MASESQELCTIGLDVGGTKIAAGLVVFSGLNQPVKVRAKKVIPTLPERGGEAVLVDSLALACQLLAEAKKSDLTVSGIGVGVCELVDLSGNVTSSHTVDWQGRPIQQAFAELAPAVVDSDVRTSAFAEALMGAGQPYKLIVYVSVGTGISCCLVQDKHPYAGSRGNALIFASSPLTMTCTHCRTVLHPVLETFASGPALVHRYNEIYAAKSRNGTKTATSRGEEILSAAAAGDPAAVEVVGTAGHSLGVSVGWLINVLDPHAVIVGGGLGSANGLYWDRFTAATREHIWSETNRNIPILQAALGSDAGFIGAAATVVKHSLIPG